MTVEIMVKLIQLLIQCYRQGVVNEEELKRYIRLAVSDKEDLGLGR